MAALAALGLTACAATAVSLAAGVEAEGGARGDLGGSAVLVGTFPWESDLPAFGGFSGLDVGTDGLGLLAVSDRATLLRGRLSRDASGAVAGVEAEAPVRLLDEEGRLLRGLPADSEGLAVDARGRVFVSFEGVPAIRRLGPPDEPAVLLPAAPEWADLPVNRSLEALAVDADGRLYAIPEEDEGGAFPVWRLDGDAWTVAFRIPRRDGFRVTDAAIGPDGRLTVLERHFSGLAFRSRLRRFDLDGTGEATLWTSASGEFDNLEGVSVWRDEAGLYGGGLRATLVSDDNFRFFQQTQLVDLRLPD